MNIRVVKVGMERTNCYIVSNNDGSTFVIDPGAEPEKIIEILDKINNLDLKLILLTHGHFDHVGGVDGLKSKYPWIKIYISGDDVELYEEVPEQGVFVGRLLKAIHSEVEAISGGQFIPFGDDEIEIIDTPGHTTGGVCFRLDKYLFTGDTLFYHTYGRVDLPHSNPKQMKASLEKIFYLRENLEVFPGHGKQTTLAEEKKFSQHYIDNIY